MPAFLEGAVQECGQLALGQSAHFGGFHVTVLEYGQGGDATYAVLLGGFRVVINVDFGNGQLVAVLANQLLKDCLLYTSPSPRDRG